MIDTSFMSSDDADWMLRHVPLFDCPDPLLQEIYYFRWSVFRKHIKSTPTGHVITEFLPQVSWAGAHNTISCAAGHHYYEGRWLRDATYLRDYTDFWFRQDGEPRRYSFWAADALYAHYLVTGDAAFVSGFLPDLILNYEDWERERKDQSGLFWQYDDRDGMEYSIGGSGLRPTINSYMYADALAISRIAELSGDTDTARSYRTKARNLKRLVERLLWDPDHKFFKVRVNNEGLSFTLKLPESWRTRLASGQLSVNKLVDICELQGYVPWYFGLPGAGFEEAWSRLMDSHQFYAPFGPTTADQSHPLFMSEFHHECLWNGPSWPFATSQTLVAMARLLREYKQHYVNESDYFKLLHLYAQSQYLQKEDGSLVPWIDENLDPYTGDWIASKLLHERGDVNMNRGQDYNHSTFCDLIISGLIGVVPSPDSVFKLHPLIPESANWDYFCLDNMSYHGHTLTVSFDKYGTRYAKGSGFRIAVDGEERFHSSVVQAVTLHL